MTYKFANYTKGQLKIQEMAFVLVAIVIFFALVAMLIVGYAFSGLKESAQDVKEEQARQLVTTLSGSAEFKFPGSCTNCVDKDKMFLIKNDSRYANFWKLDYLIIETIYPMRKGECISSNYPDCNTITLIKKAENYGTPSEAYVALCNYVNGEKRCDLARVLASVREET
jgi:hypothetical protein